MLSSLTLPGPQAVVAHFAFDAAGDNPIPAGTYSLFENLVEDRLMPDFPLLRGE